MEKLSKLEARAIACQIYEEAVAHIKKNKEDSFNKEYNKWLTKFKKTNDYRILLDFCLHNEDINDVLSKISRSIGKWNIENLLKDFFKKETGLSNTSVTISLEKIERDVIISNAMNKDLEKVMQDLFKKYSSI